MRSSRFGLLLFVSLVVAAIASACGNSNDGSIFPNGQGDGSVGSDDSSDDGADVQNLVGDDANGDAQGQLVLTPQNQSISVQYGQQTPTLQFTATFNGQMVNASFAIDRGEIGSIDASSGLMAPTGRVGGTAQVTATYGGQNVATHVTVQLTLVDNGGSAVDAGGGAGGNGGVGGEGPGGPVSQQTQMTLQGTPTSDSGLTWLYPYDHTVWPRALLAPLLQWNAPRNYDAVYIDLKENAFEYQGYFSKTATPFVHHPIPQLAWDALSYSNQGVGDDVHVTVVFSVGTTAYGTLKQTWTIAKGTLKGTVYYNSYGTNLAHNYCCTTDGTTRFGGATLAIKHGASGPNLVAGNDTECRVCHSVSADGSRLVTQQSGGGDLTSSWYDLKNGYAETTMSPGDGRFAWSAIYPDGTMLMNDGAGTNIIGSAANCGGPVVAQLFSVQSGAAIASTGIPSGLRAASPVFSPDGMHVAFNYYGGPNGDGVSLAVMDYDPNAKNFSNLRVLYTPPSGYTVWPSFLPTNDAVVFELETLNNGRDWGGTRSTCDSSGTCSDTGTQAELWWVDLATKTATRLDGLNGKGYLPTSSLHADDSVLEYEPTVSPVPSGGYAWVVFTSRRLYGNIATINPYWSDPRYHDISITPTTKKLWVAAIDLNTTAGADPSHPAFYLPGQELLAGNSRGYWVQDPCQPNGTSCQTGDECCGGYCRQVDGGIVCTNEPPPCAAEYDKCVTDVDCCGHVQGTRCINGRCAQPSPQ